MRGAMNGRRFGSEDDLETILIPLGIRSLGSDEKRHLPPYQQHVVQQLQVTIGTLPAIVQGSEPYIRRHFWVESCFLSPEQQVSFRASDPMKLSNLTTSLPACLPCKPEACLQWPFGSDWLSQ